ncbi:MAG TPA: hypothetical protein VGH32_06850, partial [Pirellulales bacterium]
MAILQMLSEIGSGIRENSETKPHWNSHEFRYCLFMPFAVLLILTIATRPAHAVDHVTLKRDGKELELSGKVLVTAKDGGILLLALDGALWNIEPQEIGDHREDERPFTPLSPAEAGRKALAELPSGFEIYSTSHYVICHNTTRAYAQWVGALYERLFAAFTTYWKNRGFKLHDP